MLSFVFQAVHDADNFAENKTLQQMISKCKLWWTSVNGRSRNISEMGKCLSKLVSKVMFCHQRGIQTETYILILLMKSCDVDAFIKSALKT
jgi:hypothetical protein